MSRLLYSGIFFDNESKNVILSLDKNKLDIIPKWYHVTFGYLEENNKILNDIVGNDITIKIIGFKNNGKNSGLLVEIPDEYKKYYNHYDENNNLIIPHITLSISKDSNNRYTKDLKYELFNKPIIISGKFGYCIEKNVGDKNSRYITFKEEVL